MATSLFGKYKVLLAPMAGVTDVPFRQLCREKGADLTYTEMVSAKGLSYANDKTRGLIDTAPNEPEVAVQLFGHEPEVIAQQAAWVVEQLGGSLALIDINMGCPARKIVKKGDGSALMRDPALAAEIVREAKNAISRADVPLTAKFRRGWHEGEETCVDFAKRLEDAGVDAMTVHGRYAEQMYRGSSDRGAIRRVTEAVSVPIVGNGDINSGADAVSMVEETGCDAVMVARAAEGNPWIFEQAKAALEGTPIPQPPSAEERLEMARRHASLLDGLGRKAVVRMRKHAMWYMHGLPGASQARQRLSGCSTLEEFQSVFDELEERLNHAS